MAASYDKITLNFLRNCLFFQSGFAILYNPQVVYEDSSCSTYLPILSIVSLSHFTRFVMASQCGFNLHFPSD